MFHRGALEREDGYGSIGQAHRESTHGGVGLLSLENGFFDITALDKQPLERVDFPLDKTGFVGGVGVG